MVLRLYGIDFFTCTRRVACILKEYNVPYELVTVDFASKEHKSPAFLEHQPFGQIPYIVDDDGFEIYESRAISRYIANKYRAQGPPLLPESTDVQKLAKFEQAASIESANFHPSAEAITSEKHLGKTPDEDAVARHLAVLKSKLAAYEVILSKQKYLAGDEITLADLFHLSYGQAITNVGIDVLESGEFPNVARWWKEISSRPSWQAVKEKA
ncbi:hypothetical protein NLI96_g7882 [Meripilus lineatus]|uniref:glutathione transferase n=1 Tax=Meripilus lineatus TaxID=2056292 RepID=A0AAD5YGR7_9APHY|nr:hypothetical protein NLI96_g7882 [Physisporinus lineatus]